MKVGIKDFNCIEKAVLEFVPGINLLVGESNGGKSSIVKAVKSCVYSGNSVNVRHGQPYFEIRVDDVAYRKGKKDNIYKVNGQILNKVGVGQVEQVAEALGLEVRHLGGEKVILNWCDQMSYPFLLDKSSGGLYRFIVDSMESEALGGVVKTINADIKSTEVRINELGGKLQVLTDRRINLSAKVKSMDKTINVAKEVLDNEKDVSSFISLCDKEIGLSRLKEEVEETDKEFNRVDKMFKTVEPMVVDIDKRKEELSGLLQLLGLNKKVSDVVLVKETLDKALQICSLEKVKDLETRDAELQELGDLIQQCKSIETFKQAVSDLDYKISGVVAEINEVEDDLKSFSV